jgi:MFS family permease
MNDPIDLLSQRELAAATRPHGAWRVVGLLTVVVALGQFNRIAISVAGAERIIGENGIDATRMGQIYSAFLLFYTLAMVPAGWLIDRFGARATLITLCLGSALFVAATAGVGLFSPSAFSLWIGLLAVRSLMGFVNAPLHPAAAAMVFAHVPTRTKSLANGLVTFAACVGISATYYGFGTLIDYFSWPTAFLVTAWITLAVAAIWTWGTRRLPALIQNSPSESEIAHGRTDSITTEYAPAPASVFFRRGVICLAISYAALGYFQYLFFYFVLNTFNAVGSGVNESRTYSTIITLTMGVGMVTGGWFADRFGRRIVPLLAMLASGIVFELGVWDGRGRTMFYAFTASAGLLGMAEASFWTTIVALGRNRGGLAASVMNTGGNAGGMLSPTVLPFIASLFANHLAKPDAVRASLAIAGIVPIVGALLWFGVPKAAD